MLLPRFALVAFLTALSAAAQSVEPPRIATVGASVTAGFRLSSHLDWIDDARGLAERHAGRKLGDEEFAERIDSVAPAQLLSAAYGREVDSFGDTMLFFRPEPKTRAVLDAAFAQPLDCVIGVDLAFWFGYGTMRDTEPGTDASLRARIERQQEGLSLLDGYLEEHPETTFVLGDYPDLTGAVPLMISAEMIPSETELVELNQRLAAWADERSQVHVFPLSKSLERLRRGECRITVDEREQVVDADAAFQIARVHPTRLGVAVMVRDLAVWLQETVGEELRPVDTSDDRLVAAAMAVDEQPTAGAATGPSRTR